MAGFGGGKVGHIQPFYLCISILGCSLGELQFFFPDKFYQAKHSEEKSCIYILTEYGIIHMYLLDIKSSPSLTGQEQQGKDVVHQVELVGY